MNDNSEILTEIFSRGGRQLKYVRGDTIIRAGDTPSGVYLINSGWVDIFTLCHDGEPNIIMSLRAGDIFPLEWVVSGRLHEASFAALTDTMVLRIPKDRFVQKLKANPGVAQAVLWRLSHHFCQLSSELENLPYHSARERVAFRLVTLVQQFGVARSDRVLITLPVPNEFIARSSNMSRETASREISWLTRKGLIERQNGRLIINNLSALEHEVGKGFRLHPRFLAR